MTLKKGKEQDGMMLAKVSKGTMLANVKVPSIPTSAACCDDVQLTNAESSSYTFYNRQRYKKIGIRRFCEIAAKPMWAELMIRSDKRVN